MSDTHKQSIKLILKVSDDLRSYDDRHVVIYRGNGPWTNPDTWSLPGVDGSGEQALVNGVQSKFGLHTNIADWEKLAEVFNPANDEINHVWQYHGCLDTSDLQNFFNHVADVKAMPLSTIRDDIEKQHKTPSPALETIIDASVTSSNAKFRLLFG